MKEIWILTSAFPYGSGEQFLETEIKYWCQLEGVKVTYLPILAKGEMRPVPTNMSIDRCIAHNNPSRKFFSLVQALFSVIFLREVIWLQQNRACSLHSILLAWRMTGTVLRIYTSLKHKRKKTEAESVVCYSYWFDIGTYGAALLKEKNLLHKVITRAHSSDVYQERQKEHYMPIKRQFRDKVDKIFTISQASYAYLNKEYAIPHDRLAIARLGVNIAQDVTPPSPDGKIEVVSIAFCIPIKRIDRIIDALALASTQIGQEVGIDWVHIGAGDLQDELIAYAKEMLGKLSNVNFTFVGQLANQEVLHYLKTHSIDVLINTSASEGIPVSIMEAMAHGIPSIAPTVGGIPELVRPEHGCLLSTEPSIEEIACALCAYDHYKDNQTRQAARQWIIKHFNAESNYTSFVHQVIDDMTPVQMKA
ncbi:glycosyltransferase [Candidatus Chloroploca sp. M-50]|uniref:Glycosyltransferase n=1 Tax=Candidatus Chloroploca mongolica TaxID=2528176 RepID=A0ABS4D5N7_9CHLR|nr:glycosyltransferase [Candidatus Chloroploca mongolica]MBP1464749.1 glycosyltransferase [Candidatus Chloroploca mongolica]